MVRMGHSSPQAALRYQHATSQREQAIATALSSLIEAETTLDAVGKGEPATANSDRDYRFVMAREWHETELSTGREQSSDAESASDQGCGEQSQRDSNPCLHLERVVS